MLDPLTELAGRGAQHLRDAGPHPTLFRRWIAFAQKLLAGGTLPAGDRELVILRTANCAVRPTSGTTTSRLP